MNFSDLFTGSNLKNFFLGSAKSREDSDTQALYRTVRALHDRSPLGKLEAADDLVFDIVVEACARAGVTPTIPLGEALFSATRSLLVEEGVYGFPDIADISKLTLEEGSALRLYLHRKRRFLDDYGRLLDMVREKVIRIFEGIIGYLPASVFDEDADRDDDGAVPLQASLLDLCENPREVVERIAATMFDADVVNARLFESLRERLDLNLCVASGILPDERQSSKKSPVLPTESRFQSDAAVADAYLGGTPFRALFESRFPFAIPFPARFEHTHIVGGSGHGKTQLLQLLIHHDLIKSQEDGRSIVVIDSQGDLLRTVSRLSCFSPEAQRSLADRLVVIDPTDIEYPVCLNMFDFDRARLARYSILERERVLNGTIELYEYFFGALLGAELTQKQGVIFKYLARLMLEIPGATVHTFRELMENGERYRPYMAKLPPSARSFFETRFFDRGFNETKKQILTRLWGVLSNPTFERMFSHPKNKVDLFEATNSGKIILINTAKDLLQHEGSAIFGRFFIALIAQGAIQRSTIAPHLRRPTIVYIDEAAEYFDGSVEHLLNQARKFKVGMVLAHQNLDQLPTSLRASIAASTSIKFAGGVSAKDAAAFASEMQCEADFIRRMKKAKGHTSFACFVKSITPGAVAVTIPLGRIENLPTIRDLEYAALIDANRARYCVRIDEIVVPEPVVSAAEPNRTPKRAEPASFASKPRDPRRRLIEKGAPEPLPLSPKDERPPAEGRGSSSSARPAQTVEARAPRPTPIVRVEPRGLGRGGRQHQYLQQLLKQLAEERGFRAVIEEPILDGAGRVDVSLTRGELRIACEISVTSTRDQELGNIEKCLAAGYGQVLLVSKEHRYLADMRRYAASTLEAKDAGRVHFLDPEAVIAHLDGIVSGSEPVEGAVRGYRVKVTRQIASAEDAAVRRAEIAKVVARSLNGFRS